MKRSIVTLGAVAAMTTAFWNQPVYRRYRLRSPHIKAGLKIIFLSDLHNSLYGKEQSRLVAMIDKAAPDLIFFGGDMADEKSDPWPVEALLKRLTGRYPMYYISGNHEYWMADTEGIHQMFRDYGVRVLLNETTRIETPYGQISLVGIEDGDSDLNTGYRTFTVKALEDAYRPEAMVGYKVLMAHRPDLIDLYRRHDFDLILSGHAHGGQARIPGILNGLYAPNQGFFPKYAGGHHALEKGDFIISRGLSFRAKMPRIFNPPEVVVITFG